MSVDEGGGLENILSGGRVIYWVNLPCLDELALFGGNFECPGDQLLLVRGVRTAVRVTISGGDSKKKCYILDPLFNFFLEKPNQKNFKR